MAFKVNRKRYRKYSRKRKIGRTLGTRKRARKSVVKNRTKVAVGLGFPKKMTMTHKYCEQVLVGTGVNGTLASYLFSCNGMYDPNITGTGHQPYYFDQMTALYDHYCVIGSQITVRVAKTDASQVVTTVGMFINDDTTVTPTKEGLLENSLGMHRCLIGIGGKYGETVFKKSWSAKKFFGGSILANTELQGNASTNPSEQSYFNFWVDSTTQTTASTVNLDVTVKYIAVWKELKDIATS